jgi:hypothetical protein
MVNDMCDRTMKMKVKKGGILNEVNSNTNTIVTTVKGFNNKSFNYKKQAHVNTKDKNADK